METFTVTPADRGLTDPQYDTLRALEEGRLTRADQQVGAGAYEEELLDLEAAGLVQAHELELEHGNDRVWVVTPRGRRMLKSIGTRRLPHVDHTQELPRALVRVWLSMGAGAGGAVATFLLGRALGWW